VGMRMGVGGMETTEIEWPLPQHRK
jgi:hypothetical protein